MNIVTNNITETIIALIALSGEIPKDINISEISKKTLQNQISKAKKEQLIKVDKNHNRIRLRSPVGLNYLSGMSNDLYEHYMMVSNGHKFKTSQKGVEAQKTFSESVLMMIRNGYQIDNMSITHTSNHFGLVNKERDTGMILGDGILNLGSDTFVKNLSITPLSESTSLIPKEEKRYYTSKYLKYGRSITERINTSRICGIVLAGENMYNVYMMNEIKIFSAAEKEMTDLTGEIYKNAYNKPRDKAEAIFISNTVPVRTSAITKTFSNYYVIPNGLWGDVVLKILETENWEEKLHNALYGEYIGQYYDGLYDDIPSWELITCNYEKIKKAKQLAGDKPINFICLKWQEPIIRQLAKNTNSTLQILTNEQLEILLNYVKGER